MKPTRATTSRSTRRKRIGRKVLQADRIASALYGSNNKNFKSKMVDWVKKPRVIASLCAVVLCVAVAGVVGVQIKSSQAATAKESALIQEAKLKQQSAAAGVCRQQKAAQKADLIGKVTFDELYDYGECDK